MVNLKLGLFTLAAISTTTKAQQTTGSHRYYNIYATPSSPLPEYYDIPTTYSLTMQKQETVSKDKDQERLENIIQNDNKNGLSAETARNTIKDEPEVMTEDRLREIVNDLTTAILEAENKKNDLQQEQIANLKVILDNGNIITTANDIDTNVDLLSEDELRVLFFNLLDEISAQGDSAEVIDSYGNIPESVLTSEEMATLLRDQVFYQMKIDTETSSNGLRRNLKKEDHEFAALQKTVTVMGTKQLIDKIIPSNIEMKRVVDAGDFDPEIDIAVDSSLKNQQIKLTQQNYETYAPNNPTKRRQLADAINFGNSNTRHLASWQNTRDRAVSGYNNGKYDSYARQGRNRAQRAKDNYTR